MAAKLKYLKFLPRGSSIQWATEALQTVKSQSLRCISIYPLDSLPETVGEAVYQELRDLDRLLVQFWTSHSIRPRVVYVMWEDQKDLRDYAPSLSLLPELTRRGLVDLVRVT